MHQLRRRHEKAATKAVQIAVVIALLLATLAVFERIQPAMTGFTVAEKTITMQLDKNITANTEIPITLEATPKTLSINGKLTGQGNAKAWLLLNDQKYLILDTSPKKRAATLNNRKNNRRSTDSSRSCNRHYCD